MAPKEKIHDTNVNVMQLPDTGHYMGMFVHQGTTCRIILDATLNNGIIIPEALARTLSQNELATCSTSTLLTKYGKGLLINLDKDFKMMKSPIEGNYPIALTKRIKAKLKDICELHHPTTPEAITSKQTIVKASTTDVTTTTVAEAFTSTITTTSTKASSAGAIDPTLAYNEVFAGNKDLRGDSKQINSVAGQSTKDSKIENLDNKYHLLKCAGGENFKHVEERDGKAFCFTTYSMDKDYLTVSNSLTMLEMLACNAEKIFNEKKIGEVDLLDPANYNIKFDSKGDVIVTLDKEAKAIRSNICNGKPLITTTEDQVITEIFTEKTINPEFGIELSDKTYNMSPCLNGNFIHTQRIDGKVVCFMAYNSNDDFLIVTPSRPKGECDANNIFENDKVNSRIILPEDYKVSWSGNNMMDITLGHSGQTIIKAMCPKLFITTSGTSAISRAATPLLEDITTDATTKLATATSQQDDASTIATAIASGSAALISSVIAPTIAAIINTTNNLTSADDPTTAIISSAPTTEPTFASTQVASVITKIANTVSAWASEAITAVYEATTPSPTNGTEILPGLETGHNANIQEDDEGNSLLWPIVGGIVGVGAIAALVYRGYKVYDSNETDSKLSKITDSYNSTSKIAHNCQITINISNGSHLASTNSNNPNAPLLAGDVLEIEF